jgi:tetratricopeptide (TPR) repeat protein
VTALSEARRALYADRLDWHVPVLYTVHVDRKALEKASGTRETPVVPPFRLDLGLRPTVVFRLEFPVPVEFTKRVEQVPLGDALLASSPHVLSVDGPPGSGKTAIAGEMARRAAQQYRGGVLGLDCRTTNTMDAILVGINETLLEPWEAQVDLTQPWGRKALCSALGQRPFLIVLDNFESILDQPREEYDSIAAFLSDLPAPSKALITSRDRLDIGQRVHIDTLDKWPFALLLARAGKRRGIAEFDQDLCDRVQLVVGDPSVADEMLTGEERRIFEEAHTKLGGLPFAAEIFMGLVAEGESIIELLGNLRPVHERMTDLLDLSYNRLSEGARETLLLMSIFSRPVKREAVQAVCDRDDWEDWLEQLIGASLVSGNRYSLHPLVREYAENKASDPTALRMAHIRAAEYFLAEDDKDPLAAIEHFHAAQSWPEVVRIANVFAEQLYRAGLWRQACLAMEMAINAARATGDRRGEVASLNHLGIFHRNLGEVQKSITYYQQALAIAREMGDRTGEGSTLRNLGNAYGVLGQLQKAIRYHKQALRIAQETGDHRGEGSSLGNLGNAYAETGDSKKVKKAIGYYERSLKISRETGDPAAEANDLSNLGVAHAQLGQARAAIECFQQALRLAVRAGDKRTQSYALGNLGSASGALGEARKAVEYCCQALLISREIGDRPAEGVGLINLGRVWSKQGEFELALACYLLALQVGQGIEDPRQERAQDNLADLETELGEEQFARLLERVQPHKERIVDEILKSTAQTASEREGGDE